MARIAVEDSDDELPALSEILRDIRVWPRKAESLSQPSRPPQPRNKESPRRKDRVNDDIMEFQANESTMNRAGRVAESTKKKRVLKPTLDNPLLRPLSIRGDAASSDLAKKTKGSLLNTSLTQGRSKKPSTSPHEGQEERKRIGALRRQEKPAKVCSRVTERPRPGFMNILDKNFEGVMILADVSKDMKRSGNIDDSAIRGRDMSLTSVKKRATDTLNSRDGVRINRKVPPPLNVYCEEDDEEVEEESDSLSDFVVDDSEEISEEEVEVPVPRSRRKLVRGRRPAQNEDEVDGLGLQLEGLELNGGSSNMVDPEDSLQKTSKEREPRCKERPSPATSSSDKAFSPQSSPSERKSREIPRSMDPSTPPGSPTIKPRTLTSPEKVQRIPATPHRQSTDAFWTQDIINDWNDEYSPQKLFNPRPKLRLSKDFSQSDDSLSIPVKKKAAAKQRSEKDAKRSFNLRKQQLAEDFLVEVDNQITDGQVASLAASTGGIKIIWNKKLNSTAGRANWRREKVRTSNLGPDGNPTIVYHNYASIELADKVIDDEDRLLNVIAHEYCHLANFMISGVKTNPHGKEFKSWAAKCTRQFGHRGIEVTTRHTYTIDYKYIWECENCGLKFKRHSKSIDPLKQRCGCCKSKLVQTKPLPRITDGEKKVANDYQMFVRDNLRRVKKENPTSPHKDIMGLVGKEYQMYKARRLDEKSRDQSVEVVSLAEDVGIVDSPEEHGSEPVNRKLVFVDLTED